MKFAHFSDVHLGSWSSNTDISKYSIKAFEKAVDECIKERVDFILIAGDLYDTPQPAHKIILSSVKVLKKCKDNGIRVYIVPGSHDYSATETTFIDVLEAVGFVTNVAKITETDDKIEIQKTEDSSGAKIYGMMGRSGSLEMEYFKKLNLEPMENEPGFKIFLFHSAIEKYRPKGMEMMDAVPLNCIPKGFDYYAAGHIHRRHDSFEEGYGKIVFPGVLFPTEIPEIIDYKSQIWIIEKDENGIKYKTIPIKFFEVETLKINVDNKTPADIEIDLKEIIMSMNLEGKFLIVKASGELSSGGPSDIRFQEIQDIAIAKGAITAEKSFSNIIKKKRKLSFDNSMTSEEIEKSLIKTDSTKDEEKMIIDLITTLNRVKSEDQTHETFLNELIESSMKALGIEDENKFNKTVQHKII